MKHNSTFCMSAEGIHHFWLFFCEEHYINKVFCLLTKCENPSSNPLQEACSGFSVAAYDSKGHSETRL